MSRHPAVSPLGVLCKSSLKDLFRAFLVFFLLHSQGRHSGHPSCTNGTGARSCQSSPGAGRHSCQPPSRTPGSPGAGAASVRPFPGAGGRPWGRSCPPERPDERAICARSIHSHRMRHASTGGAPVVSRVEMGMQQPTTAECVDEAVTEHLVVAERRHRPARWVVYTALRLHPAALHDRPRKGVRRPRASSPTRPCVPTLPPIMFIMLSYIQILESAPVGPPR
jgi:hypothetical protein